MSNYEVEPCFVPVMKKLERKEQEGEGEIILIGDHPLKSHFDKRRDNLVGAFRDKLFRTSSNNQITEEIPIEEELPRE